MPNSNGQFNTTQEQIRARLEFERTRLLDQLEQLRASAPQEDRREGSPFGKREEEATETADLENRLALEKRVLDQVSEVDHAMDKLKKGTYGRCETCGAEISLARLDVVPQARQCVNCKSKSPTRAG
jgi:DnaK suppressor protein